MEEKEKIIEIEIERLRDFKEHPFQVKDDEEMRQLKDSISEYGVLNPLIEDQDRKVSMKSFPVIGENMPHKNFDTPNFL